MPDGMKCMHRFPEVGTILRGGGWGQEIPREEYFGTPPNPTSPTLSLLIGIMGEEPNQALVNPL